MSGKRVKDFINIIYNFKQNNTVIYAFVFTDIVKPYASSDITAEIGYNFLKFYRFFNSVV